MGSSGSSVSKGTVAGIAILGAIGAFTLGVGVNAYLGGTPARSTDVLPFLVVGGMFLGITAYTLVSAMRSTEPPEPPEDAPWRVRPAWRTRTLTGTGSTGTVSTSTAVILNLVTWPVAGFVLYQAIWQPSEPMWRTLLILIFPLAGIWAAWTHIKRVLQWWKFGTSTLAMETMPARLGHSLRARLHAPIAPEDAPEEGFDVQLSCYRRYVDHSGDGSSIKRRLLWRDEKSLRGQISSEKKAATEVAIAFEIPADEIPSTPHKTTERILWELSAEADIDGLDYEISFEIPVFELSGQDPPPSEETAGVERSSADQELSGELNEPESDGIHMQEPSRQEPPPSEKTGGVEPSYANQELGTDFNEPPSDGIHMEGQPEEGLTLSFAPARAWGIGIISTVVGLACLVGGGYVLTDSFAGGVIVLAIGVGFSYGAWRLWTRTSTLTVENDRIELMKDFVGPFGTKTRTRLPSTSLEEVEVQAQRELLGTTYYSLKLVRSSSNGVPEDEGREQSGPQSGSGKPPGESILSDVIKGLVTNAFSGKVVANARSQPRTISVAHNLTNHQEADWIAEQIRQAAR